MTTLEAALLRIEEELASKSEESEQQKPVEILPRPVVNKAWFGSTKQQQQSARAIRDAEIVALYNSDQSQTYQSLGDRYGISRERVRVIITEARAKALQRR